MRRGSIANWFDDFDALVQVPWLYPQTVGGALISSGMNDALALLMGATNTATDLTYRLLRMVLVEQPRADGHRSQPGRRASASLVAPWLYDQLPKTGTVTGVAITPYTFAAPTAGNLTFARYYDSLFPGAYRCVNVDIVPMGYDNISGMQAMFPSPSQTLWAYSPFLYGTLETAKVYMQGAGVTYSQTNLKGAGTTDSFSGPALSDLSFATRPRRSTITPSTSPT